MSTTLYLYGTTDDGTEIEETVEGLDAAIAVARNNNCDLQGYLSDDAETQAAQGVKLTVEADGNYRWH